MTLAVCSCRCGHSVELLKAVMPADERLVLLSAVTTESGCLSISLEAKVTGPRHLLERKPDKPLKQVSEELSAVSISEHSPPPFCAGPANLEPRPAAATSSASATILATSLAATTSLTGSTSPDAATRSAAATSSEAATSSKTLRKTAEPFFPTSKPLNFPTPTTTLSPQPQTVGEFKNVKAATALVPSSRRADCRPSVLTGVDTGSRYYSSGDANGRAIFVGPQGGHYYLTPGGNKEYISLVVSERNTSTKLVWRKTKIRKQQRQEQSARSHAGSRLPATMPPWQMHLQATEEQEEEARRLYLR